MARKKVRARKQAGNDPNESWELDEPETGDVYFVIQAHLRSGRRTAFHTTKEAAEEARDLFTGRKSYQDYKPTSRLLVVKLVEVIDKVVSTKKLPPSKWDD